MECVSCFTWKLLAWLTSCIHLALLKDATKLANLQAAGAAIADRIGSASRRKSLEICRWFFLDVDFEGFLK